MPATLPKRIYAFPTQHPAQTPVLPEIRNLYEAVASSSYEVAAIRHDVGFRIPEYQREYIWDQKNIERVFHDCLDGFSRLVNSDSPDAFTFLGAPIFLEEKTAERDFRGVSVAIVDGQQRLVTLTLFACALYEAIKDDCDVVETLLLDDPEKNWIKEEIRVRLVELSQFAFGRQDAGGFRSFPYPRIVRAADKDARGCSSGTSEYHSPLGKFLFRFSEYVIGREESFAPSFDESVEAQNLKEKYELIRKLVKGVNNADEYEKAGCEQVSIAENLARRGYRSLFGSMDVYFTEQPRKDKAVSNLQKCAEAHGLARLLLFATYVCHRVVLMRITSKDIDVAHKLLDSHGCGPAHRATA